jgi:hypothetical protein
MSSNLAYTFINSSTQTDLSPPPPPRRQTARKSTLGNSSSPSRIVGPSNPNPSNPIQSSLSYSSYLSTPDTTSTTSTSGTSPSSSETNIKKILNQISALEKEDDEENDHLVNFEPISYPNSAYILKKKEEDEEEEGGDNSHHTLPQATPPPFLTRQPLSEDKINYTPFSMTGADANYSRIYEETQGQSLGVTTTTNNTNTNQILLEKMNYMIYLLEEDRNIKTKYITDEFMMYMFIGIFFIIVIDFFFNRPKWRLF